MDGSGPYDSYDMVTQVMAPGSRRMVRRLLPRRDNWLVYSLVVLAILVVAALGAMAYSTYTHAKEFDGRFLPGTQIAGVDVSGLTEDEARALVSARVVDHGMNSPVELSWENRSWEVTPAQVGAETNLDVVLDEALAVTDSQSWIDFAEMRFLDNAPGTTDFVTFSFDRRETRSFVAGLAREFRREPRDAVLDYSTGWVEIVREREGRELNVKRTTSALLGALNRGDAQAPLRAKVLEPAVTSDTFDKVLLLRIGENKLYLYEDGKIAHEWLVATGQPEYPTPTGEYLIELKRYMPTWVNPAPDGWGASMPDMIPPGPSNPLGTRALNWNASGIRFHGTQATYSLGHNASHGCVRMAMADIEALYDMVDVGTRIVSIQVGSYDPLYESGPDLASAEG